MKIDGFYFVFDWIFPIVFKFPNAIACEIFPFTRLPHFPKYFNLLTDEKYGKLAWLQLRIPFDKWPHSTQWATDFGREKRGESQSNWKLFANLYRNANSVLDTYFTRLTFSELFPCAQWIMVNIDIFSTIS